MSKKTRIINSIAAFTLSAAISGCGSYSSFTDSLIPRDSYEKESFSSALEIHDLDTIYSEPFQDEVLYLTIGRGAVPTDPTWEQLNGTDLSWFADNEMEPYECDALVQFGNEEAPTRGSFGYGDMASNARIRLSGLRASERQQKTYRIKINSGSGNVSGVKTLILSKSFTDPFRFTSKLCFDLMRDIDELLSVRTRFVHLYVRDESEGEDNLFVDYGMYTMIETINRKYLSNRNLDSSGELYKAENFDFSRYEDVIKQPTDPAYDEKAMEKIIEPKGSSDYTKLINLLDVINNSDMGIEEIVKNYFFEDNLYTFMAFNILMDNKDTDTENFYLYSPTGTDKFFIIPWDYDGALRDDYEHIRDQDYDAGWEKGIYLYTDSKLFGRIIRDQRCVNKLSEHVTRLHESVLSPENVYQKAKELAEQTEKYLYSLPDMAYARVTRENYEKMLEMLPDQIDNNFYAYYDSLETPWPFHYLETEMFDDSLKISWEESSILEGDVSYKIEIANSWKFDKVIRSEEKIKATSFDAGYLPEGEYFVRVTAISDKGTTQEAYEFYNTELKTTVHGVLCFYVLNDGAVIQSTF